MPRCAPITWSPVRRTIPLGSQVPAIPAVLREHAHFLYRRTADQARAVLGIGAIAHAPAPTFDVHGKATDWYFGHLCYEWVDPKGQVMDRMDGLPNSDWWVPRWVVEWVNGEAVLHARVGDEEATDALIARIHEPVEDDGRSLRSPWQVRTSREEHLERTKVLMQHIQRGDIYEVNYCTERTSDWSAIDPFLAFVRLLRRSEAPFAAFHRHGEHFALCASPERYLAMDGDRVVGEPMKGTRPRASDPVEDERLRQELMSDAKERSENIMALDVMRHDLSRIARPGSVRVEALCAVRSYPRVHQLVSTVSALRADRFSAFDVARIAFPMASMTGAPKSRAMELIQEAECGGRGLFSGSLGYFSPHGDADLNVVIRAVLFNMATGHASLRTGSALTARCEPALEWEECEVKARSVIEALEHA